jgi:RimJ/RimL family protein N-acetyltransferase
MPKKPKLGFLVKFEKAKLPTNLCLVGKYSILEPINVKKHTEDLYKNYSKDKKNLIWTYLPYGPFKNINLFKKWLRSFCLNNDPFFYAIYSKRHKTFCGMASYLHITPEHGNIEVGHINYSPLLQNTAGGTEAMYLMMKNAFDTLGNRRYEWKCNNLNLESKKATKRLGFKFEGVFRQSSIVKKRNRDTAWFSIINKEWKKYKKNYRKYLKNSNFNKQLIQKKKLKLI